MRSETKSKKRGVFRGLLILAFGILIAALTVANLDTLTQVYRQYTFGKLSPRAQNLAVFDAFSKTINEAYYDPKFSGVEWDTVSRAGRKSAETAKSGSELYLQVLHPLTGLFPSSHLFVIPPDNTTPAKTANRPQAGLSFNSDSDLGFEKVAIRRGTARLLVVGDVIAGSEAEKNGIEPGWNIVQTTIRANSSDGGHFEGIFSSPEKPEIHISYDFAFRGVQTSYVKTTLQNGISHIRLNSFEADPVTKAIKDINEAAPSGIILDLRGSSGGKSIHMHRLLGRLLPLGTNLGTLNYRNRVSQMHSFWPSKTYSGPVVVLIGPKSASASEIVASAVKFHNRAKLVGRPTSGSVLSAKRFALPDGGALVVPVADYHAPDGARIEGVGIEPDRLVVPTLADIRNGRDPALESALDMLK